MKLIDIIQIEAGIREDLSASRLTINMIRKRLNYIHKWLVTPDVDELIPLIVRHSILGALNILHLTAHDIYHRLNRRNLYTAVHGHILKAIKDFIENEEYKRKYVHEENVLSKAELEELKAVYKEAAEIYVNI